MSIRSNRRVRNGQRRPEASRVVAGGSRRLRESLGIVVLALTILVILSLLSWHADDPALSTAFTGERPVQNFAGKVGANLAAFLILALGSAAWLAPLLLFYTAIVLFIPARERTGRRFLRSSGLLAMTLALASVPRALGMSHDLFYGSAAPPGGLVGQALGGILVSLFGRGGSTVVLAALFLLGLIPATGLTLHQLGSFAARSLGGLREAVADWRERRRTAREAKKEASREAPAAKSQRSVREVRKPEIVVQPSETKVGPPPVPSKQTQFHFRTEGSFELPPLSLLAVPPTEARRISRDTLLMNSKILEKKLKDFGIDGQVTHVHPGPVVTMYEYAPAPGIKVNRIANLQDDLAMAMSAISVRVVAPIPGKSVVGIEIPNPESETVHLQEILTSDESRKSRSKLTFALGKDIYGHPVVADLARMPHLLIAGATGSGKSIMLNTIICSILFRSTPDQVRFLMIDPKMVELMPYEGIPNLSVPVVTNPKEAARKLRQLVRIMEERYGLLTDKDAKNIESYNQMVRESKNDELETMAYIVVVIDELADLMMLASNEVEESITRLAQMARAVGIHLVLATQRPSANIITGVIKANLPTRISFQVSSKIDSRVILDTNGAEALLGRGDMLFLAGGSKLRRIHGAYISEAEIKSVVDCLKKQATPEYDEELLHAAEEPAEADEELVDEADDKYQEAVELVRRTGQASISMIQRRLRVGYNRAARMVELMEKEGIITPPDGVRPRRILPPGN